MGVFEYCNWERACEIAYPVFGGQLFRMSSGQNAGAVLAPKCQNSMPTSHTSCGAWKRGEPAEG